MLASLVLSSGSFLELAVSRRFSEEFFERNRPAMIVFSSLGGSSGRRNI